MTRPGTQQVFIWRRDTISLNCTRQVDITRDMAGTFETSDGSQCDFLCTWDVVMMRTGPNTVRDSRSFASAARCWAVLVRQHDACWGRRQAHISPVGMNTGTQTCTHSAGMCERRHADRHAGSLAVLRACGQLVRNSPIAGMLSCCHVPSTSCVWVVLGAYSRLGSGPRHPQGTTPARTAPAPAPDILLPPLA